jgi:Pyridine nucleotide-disulphide oxidoreductase
MDSVRDIVVVGAGPYGLSLAAHLAPYGSDFQILGSPMRTWLSHMPDGMVLKSEGFASNLDDPKSALTLGRYCREAGLPYADIGLPVPRKTFASYGLEFQKRFAPELGTRMMVRLDRSSRGFEIGLADGDTVAARTVVLAVGLTYFQHVPPVLARLPKELVTHSSYHHTFGQFQGRDVVVVGGGASAMDVAASLREAGAAVQVVARTREIRFHDGPASLQRSLMARIRAPMNGLGPGWRSLACVEAPLLFHVMPERFRLEVARRHLGPAAGWTTKKQVVGKMPFHLGYNVHQAEVEGQRVRLELAREDGSHTTISADHVIAGTGYRVDLNRLPFLSPRLRADIRCAEDTPVLTSHFESSVPGLYFAGIAAASSFGPLLRFVYGARFTARRLSRHLAASRAPQCFPSVEGKKNDGLQNA